MNNDISEKESFFVADFGMIRQHGMYCCQLKWPGEMRYGSVVD